MLLYRLGKRISRPVIFQPPTTTSSKYNPWPDTDVCVCVVGVLPSGTSITHKTVRYLLISQVIYNRGPRETCADFLERKPLPWIFALPGKIPPAWFSHLRGSNRIFSLAKRRKYRLRCLPPTIQPLFIYTNVFAFGFWYRFIRRIIKFPNTLYNDLLVLINITLTTLLFIIL